MGDFCIETPLPGGSFKSGGFFKKIRKQNLHLLREIFSHFLFIIFQQVGYYAICFINYSVNYYNMPSLIVLFCAS